MQYNEYAATYDRSGQLRFSVLMDLYLRDLLRLHPASGQRMLDLACGTGTLALLMAERGWDVLGIDLSPAMLAAAERKCVQAGCTRVRFRHGDMRDVVVDTPVDLVTCCYDTLNYLLDQNDLARCFTSVAQSLTQNGLFCFDLATDYFLRHHWTGIDFEQFDDFAQVTQSHYDETTGYSTLVLTGFVEQSAGRFTRFREVHIERAYPDATICMLLGDAGFVVEAVYDCFTNEQPNERSLRLMYVARKQGSSG